MIETAAPEPPPNNDLNRTNPHMAKDTKQTEKTDKSAKADSSAAAAPEVNREQAIQDATARLQTLGRNDACLCGSGKKYKKCHWLADEQLTTKPPEAPDAQKHLANAWGLFEQRRPGAAEREFRAALQLDPNLTDARVGVGMSRLSANDADGAKAELGAVVAESEAAFTKLREDKVKDAFTRVEAQPLIRAAHALGCLAYDQERFEDAYASLEKVFAIDEGPVGTEARLIAGKALMKQSKAADAVAVLEPAVKADTGAGRARLGLALAHFVAGAESEAHTNLDGALHANAHFGKALLGRIRRRVENLAGSQPGSIEEALVYAQTYGDVWTAEAKAFLEKALDERASKAPAKSASEATAAP